MIKFLDGLNLSCSSGDWDALRNIDVEVAVVKGVIIYSQL